MNVLRRFQTRPAPIATLLLLIFSLAHGYSDTSPLRTHPACQASPVVQAVLDRYEKEYRDRDYPAKKQFLEEQLQAFPRSLHLHRIYQDLIRFGDRDPGFDLEARYQKWMETYPDDPRFRFLYARLLVQYQPDTATEILQSILHQDPHYPWAHFLLAMRYNYLEPRDPARASQHARAALEACPYNQEFYAFVDLITDRTFLSDLAQRLRTYLDTNRNIRHLPLYRQLWTLEFKITPPPQHDRVRDQIRSDLKGLEILRMEGEYRWWEVLRFGYRQLGDHERRRAIEDEILRRFPKHGEDIALDRIQEEAGPRPRSTDKNALSAYIRKEIQLIDRYLERLPQSTILWWVRLNALTRLETPPKPELKKTAERLLALYDRDPFRVSPPIEIQIAEAYVKADLEPEKVLELVDRGMQQAALAFDRSRRRKDRTEKTKARLGESYAHLQWLGDELRLKALWRLKRWDAVDELVERMGQWLEAHRPTQDTDRRWAVRYRDHRQTYWQLRTEIALDRGRDLDALAYYQRYRATVEPGKEDQDLARRVHATWTKLGGSEFGWQAWLTKGTESDTGKQTASVEKTGPWESWVRSLPDFALYDLNGRTWTPADFRGRTVFLNLWATWCGPCLAELPYIQELYERLKDRPDMLLVTFNVDADVGLVQPFAAKNRYTFPVVLAAAFFAQYVEYKGIPQSWIIAPDGKVVRRQIGFGGEVTH